MFHILLFISLNFIQFSYHADRRFGCHHQSDSSNHNSLLNPTFLSTIHPDFVLPLSSLSHLTHHASDDVLSLSAIVQQVFEKARALEGQEEELFLQPPKTDHHGISAPPSTPAGDSFCSSKCVFVRWKDCYYLNEQQKVRKCFILHRFQPVMLLQPKFALYRIGWMPESVSIR